MVGQQVQNARKMGSFLFLQAFFAAPIRQNSVAPRRVRLLLPLPLVGGQRSIPRSPLGHFFRGQPLVSIADNPLMPACGLKFRLQLHRLAQQRVALVLHSVDFAMQGLPHEFLGRREPDRLAAPVCNAIRGTPRHDQSDCQPRQPRDTPNTEHDTPSCSEKKSRRGERVRRGRCP